MTKGSDLLVAALENEGVQCIFAIPGEENLDVLESLRRSKVKLVLTRHEQAAGFMAATYGRLTGRAGVCLTTLGPGALNLTTAAAYAHLGAMPMVMITGQKAIRSSRQARFQIVDIVATMRPLTKMATQIVSAQSIPTLVRDAFRVAQQERPGPVHLELPEDIAADAAAADIVPQHVVELPIAPPAAIERAAAMIMAARRPLVMLGAAASRPHLAGPLSAFVRRASWVHEAIDQADLIISIGHDTVEKPPFLMGRNGPQVIHVGATPATVEQVYFPQAEIVGDVGASLAGLADRLEGKLPHASALLGLREGILAHLAEGSTEDRFPLTPQRIVHDVRKVIPPDGIVALDNGMYKIWFARNYRTSVANTLLLDNALATMGAGLPSAIAASLINPDKRVLAVCGDGGFMMNSQELETAVRLKQNLVVLVLEDRAYGMIRWKQEVDGFSDFGLGFGNPDFVSYAKSYGAKGSRVGNAAEFATVLETAFLDGGVHLVVAPIDYSENMRVLVHELHSV